MANGAVGVVSSPLPNWQKTALVVGAPVVLGLGYMYYRNASKPDRGSNKRSGKANGIRGDKQISTDGEDPFKTGTPEESESPSERAQRHKNLGNAVFKAGKFDEAIAQYNMAIEACPEDNKSDLATFYQNRAAAYEQLKKYSAVKEDCTRALELNPKYIKALLRRARAMERMNELELVLEDVTSACFLEQFQNQSTVQMADRVLKQLGKQHAQEHMENNIPIMPSERFIQTYFTSFRRNPFAVETTEVSESLNTKGLERAQQALKDQRYDDVIPICTEEIDRLEERDNPVKMQLYLLRATFNILLGQADAAMPDLDIVINSDSASKAVKVNALINRARLFMQVENNEKCFEDYKLAVEIDADCSDIYHHRGQMNLALERMDEAKEDAEKALSLDPDFGIGYVQKCYTDYRYAVTKRLVSLINEAMINFEKAFEKFPDCADCYTVYAQVLADLQEFEKADKYFAKANIKDPKNATVLVHRGLLQLQWNGNVLKAVEYIKKALEVDDKSEPAYEALGTIEVQRGNLREAIDLFDKAVDLSRTFMGLTHIFSLKDAAEAQLKVLERLGVEAIWMPQGMS